MDDSNPPDDKRSDSEQQKLSAAIIDLFERRICFNEHLGLKVRELWSEPVLTALDMRPEWVGHYLYGRLHGGIVSSVLDTTGGLAVMSAMAKKYASDSCLQIMHRFASLGTIDMRVDYLRQGKGQHFVADADVVRLGGRIANTRMNLFSDDGTLIATGSATYILTGAGSGRSLPGEERPEA